ncbi:hypothetical protein ACS0TY_020360 [Phlomoides rotata]
MLLILLFILWHIISLDAAAKHCHPEDRAALIAFKQSFSNPDPFPYWTSLFDCCDWNGVMCDPTTHHVIGLDIAPAPDINGTIPSNISNLKHLINLRLHRIPNLVGQIPESISKLPLLRTLVISRTKISGPVPGFLAHLNILEYLDLSFNRLSGSISPSLATLPLIRFMDLSRNQLIGPIPELFTSTTVEFPTLDLSHNNLSGHLSASLSRINFTSVDISRNGLSGDASVLFGKGKATGTIVISRNDFEFDFSRVAFSESLYVLDVSHNRIYGRIPQQITEAYNLQSQSLNVSYNRLCGKIPSGWELKDNSSFFHNKCLCGAPLDPCK